MIPVTFSRHENPALAEQIRRDIEQYIAHGGNIQQCSGFSGITARPPAKYRTEFKAPKGKPLRVKQNSRNKLWYVLQGETRVSRGYKYEQNANAALKSITLNAYRDV